MSTRIYTGCYLDCPITEAIPSLQTIKQHMAEQFSIRVRNAAMHKLVKLAIDRSVTGEYPDLEQFWPCTSKSRQKKISSPEGCWTWAFSNVYAWARWDEFTDLNVEIDPRCNLELKVSLFPDPENNRTYMMAFGSDDLIQDFLHQPEVRDFSYWNNSDKPEDVSEEAWNERKSIWLKLVKTSPANDGFSYTLFSSLDVIRYQDANEKELDHFLAVHRNSYIWQMVRNELTRTLSKEADTSDPGYALQAYMQAGTEIENNSEMAIESYNKLKALVPETGEKCLALLVES